MYVCIYVCMVTHKWKRAEQAKNKKKSFDTTYSDLKLI